jgi:hypothetical protein
VSFENLVIATSFNPEPTATALTKTMKNAKPRIQNAKCKAHGVHFAVLHFSFL